MSIYVSVTRRAHPLDDTGPTIQPDEWSRLIDGDPEFRHPTQEEIAAQARWLGPSAMAGIWGEHSSGSPIWFVYCDGNVDVKNPDAELLRKMASVARTLRARVVSETGELFDTAGASLGIPGDRPPSLLARLASWLKRS